MTRSDYACIRNLTVGAFALAAVLLADAGYAQQCVSPEAKSALARCPAGALGKTTKRKGVSFRGTPPPAKKRRTDIRPVDPVQVGKDALRDERRIRLEPKLKRLLLIEIATMERLYASTPKKSPERPGIMRRLADNYVELESSAFRDKVEAEVQAQRFRKKSPRKAAAFKQRAQKAKKVVAVGRRKAIAYYEQLVSQYPQWCQFPGRAAGERGCIDEVLYYLAYEHEQNGDLQEAREVYLRLTEDWKSSRFLPHAYLAFGELYFQEAQSVPSQWSIAANFYREVLKFRAPANKLWGYAAYKLAYVHWNLGEYDRAIDMFVDVVGFAKKHAGLASAAGLGRSARRDIIPVYALAGKPGEAYRFFKPLSEKGDDATTYDMMEDLGQNLLDTGHYPEAILLYRDLRRRRPRGERSCFYQAQISRATMAHQSGDKEAIVGQLREQLDAYRSSKDSLECANATAALLTETAMSWHLEAIGSGGVRGTGDAATMDRSAELYRMVVDNFDAGQFARFKFPRVVKEDWPTVASIKYAMADLLFARKDWAACGPAFDAAVAEDPNGPDAPEAAIAALECYQHVYLARHQGDSQRQAAGFLGDDRPAATPQAELAPRPLDSDTRAMLTAFDRYLCRIEPPEGDREALEKHVDVKYARARVYFDAHHWEEAAWAFRDIAIEHPQAEAAIFAAHLYLEALNVMATRLGTGKPACLDMMAEDVPVFTKTFCATASKQEAHEEQCRVFGAIEADLERLEAERLVRGADDCAKTGGCDDRLERYERGAELYLKLWKKRGEAPCRAGDMDACRGQEEVLYNAARAFQAARLLAKAIAVRKILTSPVYHLEATEPARKAVYEVGGNYQAIAVYDLAAAWFERFAEESPKRNEAPQALSDAVVLRLGLGHHDKALEDAERFHRRYGRDPEHASKASQIAFAIGAHHADREEWSKAQGALGRRAMAQIDRSATFDVRIQAHALLGRIHARVGQERLAERQYDLVRSMWADPAATQKQLDALGGTTAEKDRRLGRVLSAVGEAMFHHAEKAGSKAAAISFPVYRGSGDRAGIERFVGTELKTWMKEKGRAVAEAEKAYAAIVDLEPVPPPQWVVAAGARVGSLWGDFVAEFRAAPYPKEWDQPGTVPGVAPPLYWAEVRSKYFAEIDRASEPWKERAKAAYRTCLAYSVTYQYFDEDSRRCEEWLSKSYPREFHLIDEFRGAPTRGNSGLDERPLALDMGGVAEVARP